MDEVAGIQRGQYDDTSSNKQWFSKTDNLSHERGRCDISVVSKRKQKRKMLQNCILITRWQAQWLVMYWYWYILLPIWYC